MEALAQQRRVEVTHAACAGLTELFFSDEHDDAVRAIEVCGSCGAQVACLEGARAQREPCGVWGGRVFRDGIALDAPPKRGRPAKAA